MKQLGNEKATKTIVARLAVLLITLAMLITSLPFGLMAYANEAEDTQKSTEQGSDTAQAQTEPKNEAAEAPKQDAKEQPKKEEPKDNAPKEDAKKATKDTAENEDSDNGVLEVSSPTGSYTVDFYFTAEDGTETEYHLKGGTSIMLSELFKKLGIDRNTADIKETVFTDNELVKFVKEGDDYRVISLKPFDTEESLTITFEDGDVIKMRVEDENRTLDYNINWNLDGNGTLTIRLLNSATSGGFTTDRTTQAAWNSFWATGPGASTYIRSRVKKVIIKKNENNVGINVDDMAIAYMFSGFNNLESVEIQEGALSGSPKNIASMFRDCKKLTEIKGLENLDTTKVTDMSSTFNGVGSDTTGEGLKLDLSSWKNNEKVHNLQNMFANSRVEEVILNNENFKTRPYANGGCQMGAMFYNANKLKKIDMSNITLTGRPDSSSGNGHSTTQEAGGILSTNRNGNPTLETVIMNNTKFVDMANFNGMFSNCPNLKKVEMKSSNPGDMAPDAEYMDKMFANSGIGQLDVSGFGELGKIVNMDGFVEGCKGLEVLNISNLDNSIIGPKNKRHSITPGQDGYIDDRTEAVKIGAIEFGRALFGLDDNGKSKSIDTELPVLKTIYANNSKVWMCFNNRGLPGQEYYNAAYDSDIYYFTDKIIQFAADDETHTTITTDRDYIDLITDRDGTNVPKTVPEQDPLPDAEKNINIKDGDLNTNGPGMLAPGVYFIGQPNRLDPAEASMCDTFYRIAYIGQVPYDVECDHPDLIQHDGQDNTYITTKAMEWPNTGDKTIDCSSKPIKITYKDAAIDVNGKKHDVLIEVTKITFKDIGNIPTDPGTDKVQHDNNKYIPENREYYRPILQANKSDGVQFMNYVRYAYGIDEPWSSEYDCLSKGSGTDIEFKISIVGASEDTSFVFKGEDMDVAKSQEWNNSDEDACEDELPIKKNTYGLGGEGFVLGSGNDLGTVKFAEHTGLVLVDDTIMATGSDPHTPWSEFTVKANAYSGAEYKWTSGISCTSYALRNTKAQDVGATSLQPQVLKELINGTLEDDQFEFVLEKVSTNPDGAPEPENLPQPKKNTADGKVTFDKLNYKTEGKNSLIDGSDKTHYYPGTSPVGNEHGKGKHNKFTYTYKVYEKIPADAQTIAGHKVKDSIIYDETEHVVKIVITTPENDTEMVHGIKAEIYVDKTPGAEVTPDKTYWHREKACVDCSNGTPTTISADKWYDKDGEEIQDPNPIPLSNLIFKNKKIDPVELKIPVQKILQGRSWKDTDEFAAGLVLVSNDAPMPDHTQIIGDGRKVSEVLINNEDTPVRNDDDKIIGYKDTFKPITYTVYDLGKTYEYDVRELMPSESSAAPIPGVTYDTKEYDVIVKITLDETDPDDPKLVATAEYKDKDGEVTISSFTNIYDAEETDYKMEAVKDFWDVSKEEEIQLEAGEFTFAVKPIGENAAIAPMPAGYEGSGADRRYYKTNERDGDIEFEGHPDQIKDGMVFNYKELLAAGIDDADLHSDKGVDFEYVIYEIIPGTPEGITKGKTLTSKETLVNNEDGTYSVIGDDEETVYDGVHHTRKITVKVIQGDAMETGETVTIDDQPYKVYKDFKEVEYYKIDGKAYKRSDNTPYTPDLETLDVEGHPDDHKACYYISEKGGESKEIPMSEVEGYDPKRHHFKVNEEGEEVQGAPIFINYRFEQKYVDLKVKKVWDDGNDSDKIRPKSITMTITSDEGDYKPKDLVIKGSSWTASEKLPVWEFDIKTEKLKKITYSVEESNVPTGYEVSYSPDPSAITLNSDKSEFALTVTNKHVPKKKPSDDKDDDGDKTDKANQRGANTGDSNNAAIWITLMAAAVVAVVAVIIRRRRTNA